MRKMKIILPFLIQKTRSRFKLIVDKGNFSYKMLKQFNTLTTCKLLINFLKQQFLKKWESNYSRRLFTKLLYEYFGFGMKDPQTFSRSSKGNDCVAIDNSGRLWSLSIAFYRFQSLLIVYKRFFRNCVAMQVFSKLGPSLS